MTDDQEPSLPAGELADASRLNRERSFYDQQNREVEEYGAGRFYAVAELSRRRFRECLGGDWTGLRALECGCGPGSYAFLLGRRGAEVVGVDISAEAIRQATKKAANRGASNVSFQAMNLERLDFPDQSFDLICGNAILHHLNLDSALAELARVLKPGGRAVFLEPLGHNPIINLYRRLTPQYRTPDEHPLRRADLQRMSRYFGEVRAEYFHLLALLAVPFRKWPGFSRLVKVLGLLDQILFAVCPCFRWWSWTCLLTLTRPVKPE